jgi:hypothetical protein
MAALVASNLTDMKGGDRDSVGFFQMRVGIWNHGKYAGYPDKPELQLEWFVDQALAAGKKRAAAGIDGKDSSKWGVPRAIPAAARRGAPAARFLTARLLRFPACASSSPVEPGSSARRSSSAPSRGATTSSSSTS